MVFLCTNGSAGYLQLSVKTSGKKDEIVWFVININGHIVFFSVFL